MYLQCNDIYVVSNSSNSGHNLTIYMSVQVRVYRKKENQYQNRKYN